MSGFQAATAVAISGAFVYGMVLSLLGSIRPALAKRLGVSEERVGGLLTLLHVAFVPMVLISGPLADRMDVRLILVAGSILTALALYGLTIRNTFQMAMLSVLGVGLGAALLSTASVVLMPQAFFGGDPKRMTAALSLGCVFFALGSLVTPTLADTLLRLLNFRRTVCAVALLTLVPAAIVALTLDSGGSFQLPTGGDAVSLLGDWRIWLAGAAFFLYAPMEFAVATWAMTFLTDIGYKERRAARLLSGFWLTFLASRIALAYLQDDNVLGPKSDLWVIPLAALGSAVVLGNLTGSPGRGRTGWGLLVLGAVLGPIFPSLLSVIFQLPSASGARGAAFGMTYALGSLGSILLTPLIGWYAHGQTVQRVMRIPMALALVLAGAVLVLALVSDR
jgi:fucose permease